MLPCKRVWYQRVVTCCTHAAEHHHHHHHHGQAWRPRPTNSHTPPRTREGEVSGLAALTGKQMRLTWIGGGTGLLGDPPPPTFPLSTEWILQERLHELHHLELRLSWQAPPPAGLLRASTECSHVFILFISFFILFLPAFFNIVYILCIIAFGASSFYSFLYQKCTTLLSSFELLECCLFQMGKLSKKKDTHCALFFIWSVYFLQDVEIARSFTERVHPSRLWCCSWFMKKLTVGAALSQICYLLILDSSCRMFIVQCRQCTACTHFITHGFLKHWS